LSNLCNISIYKEVLCWLNSELSFISLHIFEMLSDCFISWLYMGVEAYIRQNIFFSNFPSIFCFSVWSVLTVSPIQTGVAQKSWWSGYTSGHARPVACFGGASRRVNDPSGRGPPRVKASISPLVAALSSFSLYCLSLLGAIFSCFTYVFSVIFVCCAYLSPF
jgi:hypothetical protein